MIAPVRGLNGGRPSCVYLALLILPLACTDLAVATNHRLKFPNGLLLFSEAQTLSYKFWSQAEENDSDSHPVTKKQKLVDAPSIPAQTSLSHESSSPTDAIITTSGGEHISHQLVNEVGSEPAPA